MNYKINKDQSNTQNMSGLLEELGETLFFEEPKNLHTFSDEYMKRKKQILADSGKHSIRPILNVAAILIGIFCLVPVTVLGARFIRNYLVIHKDSGKYQDEFTFEKSSEAEPFASVIHVKVIADFPDEYVRINDVDKLIWETTDGKSISMVLYRAKEFNKLTLQGVISQNEVTVNGYKAVYSKLNTATSISPATAYDKNMLIFFEDKGYALEILGNANITEEDFLKLTEKVSLKETTYDQADVAASIINSGDTSINSSGIATDIETPSANDNINASSAPMMNEYFDVNFYDYANIETNPMAAITLPVKVTNASIADNMSELGDGVWIGHNPENELVNADGTFIDYTRSLIKEGDEINTLSEIIKTESVPQKIAVITLEFYNNTNSDAALGLNGYMFLDVPMPDELSGHYYKYDENPSHFYPLWMDSIERQALPVGTATGYMSTLHIPAQSTQILNIVFPLDADRMHNVEFSINDVGIGKDDIIIPIDDKYWDK